VACGNFIGISIVSYLPIERIGHAVKPNVRSGEYLIHLLSPRHLVNLRIRRSECCRFNRRQTDARLRNALPQRRSQINRGLTPWGLRAADHRARPSRRHDPCPPHHGKAAIPPKLNIGVGRTKICSPPSVGSSGLVPSCMVSRLERCRCLIPQRQDPDQCPDHRDAYRHRLALAPPSSGSHGASSFRA
jgi:hypothetical protein